MPQPIELWFWPTPNGIKISIALEEMGLAYKIRPINIGTGEQFTLEFQALSPNGRMPAIIDHDGPDGKPISLFESGAILQYLARKTGKFYGADERSRIEVDQWLFWQMAGLGPMAGQTHHFRHYAPAITNDQRHLAYGVSRYTNETRRLYSVIERRLQDRDYLAGDYSIADMAAWPWIIPTLQGQDLDSFPKLKAWHARIKARPAVEKGKIVGAELRRDITLASKDAEAARKVLFGQRGH
ncbi:MULTISPECIES: glutathione S-transferase N-terminal domain-containing protein [unclassified Brevundimonas]|uniref:glutathione S-transferase N-terminal domain-containing protein n=1 Tax=unclassified Brevundimonas TaxID=2622653 RepID=UPI0025BF2372|nr:MULTISPECIES: glutathione S-transferase N-terminal domain-containing protein [unclassified Brevundimonas]